MVKKPWHKTAPEVVNGVSNEAQLNTKNTGDTEAPTSAATSNDKDTPASTEVNLQVPFGAFVSNHAPSMGETPSRNAENSSCQTTAGASCTIQFTKAGVTKSLASQVTDANGVTTWNWTPQSIGLEQGTWEIQAIAKLGSQTKTATDSIKLQVQP